MDGAQHGPVRRLRARSTLKAVDTYAQLISLVRDLADDGLDIPCQRPDVSGEWWFSDEERLTRRAKMLCRVCPVIITCQVHAMAQHEWGIWGGMDHHERLDMRRSLLLGADTGPAEVRQAI